MITAKRFDNGTVVKADKWSMVQFFSAGKKLDTKGARGLLKASPAEVAEHPVASVLRDEFLAQKAELQKVGRVVDGEIPSMSTRKAPPQRLFYDGGAFRYQTSDI